MDLDGSITKLALLRIFYLFADSNVSIRAPKVMPSDSYRELVLIRFQSCPNLGDVCEVGAICWSQSSSCFDEIELFELFSYSEKTEV
jgi:hypothetical protein